MGEDDAVAAWVETVRAEQRRTKADDDRAELIEALGHAVAAAKRMHGTPHYARAHAAIDTLLDGLVGR